MIDTATIDRLAGQDVRDPEGSKIGSVSGVYLDDRTGRPEWVTVNTGLFGTEESFVPVRDAHLAEDGLHVPVTRTWWRARPSPTPASTCPLPDARACAARPSAGRCGRSSAGRSPLTTEPVRVSPW